MRHLVQRFSALAIAIALVFGMSGVVGAQTVPPPAGGSDSDSVTVTADQVGYIEISLNQTTVALGALDAFGIKPGGYGSTAICSAQNTASSTTYSASAPTTATVKSTTPYGLTVNSVSNGGSNFVIFLDGACGTPIPLGAVNGQTVSSLPATTRDGSPFSVNFGAVISVGGPGYTSSTLDFTFTASPI